ncbi:basic salivary proline-rich protein 1-like [Myotis myotis]|uniref:basic salivary proline-rich protein 1-like n=1 Tax=Myotis myotis TaxID=51298 RepID=UPI00174A097D|nr:basic salivary proline-rich protein 1-like [Myotis myotis]
MGNLLSRFLALTRGRRRRALPGARRPVAFRVRRGDAPPGRAHPAAPAPALGPGHRVLPWGPAPALGPGYRVLPWGPAPALGPGYRVLPRGPAPALGSGYRVRTRGPAPALGSGYRVCTRGPAPALGSGYRVCTRGPAPALGPGYRVLPRGPAPALGPGFGLLPRGPAPAAAGCLTAVGRPCPLPETGGFPLRLRPSVGWEDPPEKPRLCFRYPRTVYIPPPRGRLDLPRKEVQVMKPKPARTIPLPPPKDMEVKVQERSPKGRPENQDHQVQNKGQRDQDSPYRRGGPPLTWRAPEPTGVLPAGKSGPGPVGLHAQHPQGSVSGSTPLSPRSCSSKVGVVAGSGSPEGGALPALQPNPTPFGFLQPQSPAERVLRGDPPPSVPVSPPLREEVEAPKPSSSHPPPASAPRKFRKRTMPLPLQLPLPPLRWDRGQLPPPPKLPCLAGAFILGADPEARAGCSATQSAPSPSPPGSAMADTLPLATHPGQVPAPITAGAPHGLTSQPPLHDVDSEMDTTPPCYARTYPESTVRIRTIYQSSDGQRDPPGAPPADKH